MLLHIDIQRRMDVALTNAQYNTILKGYETRQIKNRHMQNERQEYVYAHVEGYHQLDTAVATSSVERIRKLLSEDDNDTVQTEDLSLLTAKKKALLISAGLPAEYLDPIYDCLDCQDTGYIEGRKCHCFKQQMIDILYEQSNIQNLLSSDNFDMLSYEYYQGEDLIRFENAVKTCQNFVTSFSKKHGSLSYENLFFYGTVGTGKSFLSGCVAKELLEQEFSVIYFSSIELFNMLARYSFDIKAKDSLYNIFEDLYNCDLVIIDDLGTEVTNSFVTSQLFSCLNERHLRRKSTVISTNLSLEELRDRYSDRIFSRITSNYQICKLSGPDIRIYKKRMANRK